MCFRDKAYDDVKRAQALSTGDKRTATMFTAESEESIRLMDELKERVKATESQVLWNFVCSLIMLLHCIIISQLSKTPTVIKIIYLIMF